MTAERKVALLRAIFEDFSTKGDVSRLLESLTEDVVYKLSIGPGTPLSGEFEGREAVARYFREMPSVVDHLGFNVYDFLANEDTAVVTGDETLRVIKNGVVFFTEWVVVCRFRGDRMHHILVVENIGAISQAYGAPPAEPPHEH